MLNKPLYTFRAATSENNLEFIAKVQRFLRQLGKVGEKAFDLIHQQLAARD
jgi:hypothetical protein